VRGIEDGLCFGSVHSWAIDRAEENFSGFRVVTAQSHGATAIHRPSRLLANMECLFFTWETAVGSPREDAVDERMRPFLSVLERISLRHKLQPLWKACNLFGGLVGRINGPGHLVPASGAV
jgi:hypothetical protein